MPTAKPVRKNQHVETLRGIAILLLVYYHVVEYLKLDAGSVWRYIQYPFDYSRVPLFTCISGFVYALRPIASAQAKTFLLKKLSRLSLPMFAWASATYLIFHLAWWGTFDLRSYSEALFYPYQQFWFLQVMLLIFPFTVLMEMCGRYDTFQRWLSLLFGSLLCMMFYRYVFPGGTLVPLHSFSFFSFSGFFYLLPFFLLGIGLQRFIYEKGKLTPKHLWVLGMIAVSGSILRFIAASHRDDPTAPQSLIQLFSIDQILGASFSIISLLFVFNIRFSIPILAKIGNYAYQIYLIHIIAIFAIAYPLNEIAGVNNLFILIPLCVVVGFSLPIALTHYLSRSDIACLILFGLGKRKKSPLSDEHPEE